jgi:uncharacterized protein involved in response to NO
MKVYASGFGDATSFAAYAWVGGGRSHVAQRAYVVFVTVAIIFNFGSADSMLHEQLTKEEDVAAVGVVQLGCCMYHILVGVCLKLGVLCLQTTK